MTSKANYSSPACCANLGREKVGNVRIRLFRLAGLALAAGMPLLGLAACSKKPEPTPTPVRDAGTTRHPVRGVVRGLDLLQNAVIVEHEDIPGFMPSMTMPFTAKNPEEISSLKVGEAVEFDFVVTADDSWLEGLRSIAVEDVHLPEKSPPPPGAGKKAPRVREGDRLPDFQLVDQKNENITRETFAGKPLLLTFIFTRCPVPDFCPKISGHFETLARELAQDPARAEQVRLLSISFDPEFDTPEVLDAYGRSFSANPAQWRFATGSVAEIEKLTQAFAVYTKAEKGTIDHGLCTALVAPDGTIQAIWRGNGWKPEEVLAALKALPDHAPESEENHDPSQSQTSIHHSESPYSIYEKNKPNHAS